MISQQPGYSIYAFAKMLGVADIMVKRLIDAGRIQACQNHDYGYTSTEIPVSELPIAAAYLAVVFEGKRTQIDQTMKHLRRILMKTEMTTRIKEAGALATEAMNASGVTEVDKLHVWLAVFHYAVADTEGTNAATAGR